MLRHRWGRAIEVWTGYQTFLQRQVLIGPDHVCMNDIVVAQTTHTLLTVYYSFIYSLFDPSAMNFPKVTANLLKNLPKEAIEVRQMILDHWKSVQKPISIIRSNIGFHGSPKERGTRHGYAAYRSLHPWASEYLMTLMRVFFRLAYEVFDSKEPTGIPPNHSDTVKIFGMAKEMKAFIDANPGQGVVEQLAGFFKRVKSGEISLPKHGKGSVH